MEMFMKVDLKMAFLKEKENLKLRILDMKGIGKME